MAWTLPHVFSVGEVVTALTMNQLSTDITSPTIDYAETVGAVTVTGAHTAITTATTLVQGNAITSVVLNGTQGIKLEFYCFGYSATAVQTNGNTFNVAFYDGTVAAGTQIGISNRFIPNSSAVGPLWPGMKGERVLNSFNGGTPVSATHTYQVACYITQSGDSITFNAGAGGSGNGFPMSLRVSPA